MLIVKEDKVNRLKTAKVCRLPFQMGLALREWSYLCSAFSWYAYMIGHYNHSVSIIDLVSHTAYVMCVHFIHKWRDLQFIVDSERKFFEKLFMAIFIYSQSFCQKSAERKSPKKYLLYFCFDVWPGARTLALRLISQHTTY